MHLSRAVPQSVSVDPVVFLGTAGQCWSRRTRTEARDRDCRYDKMVWSCCLRNGSDAFGLEPSVGQSHLQFASSVRGGPEVEKGSFGPPLIARSFRMSPTSPGLWDCDCGYGTMVCGC